MRQRTTDVRGALKRFVCHMGGKSADEDKMRQFRRISKHLELWFQLIHKPDARSTVARDENSGDA
jgi:hypothetical protein